MLDVIEQLENMGGDVRDVLGETRVYIDASAHITQFTKDTYKKEAAMIEAHRDELWICPMTRKVRVGGFDISDAFSRDILDALGIDDNSLGFSHRRFKM